MAGWLDSASHSVFWSHCRSGGPALAGCERFWHAFFAIDQQLEALCRLLMEETESRCPHGRLYFELLAQALAVAVLSTVRDEHLRKSACCGGAAGHPSRHSMPGNQFCE